MAKSSIIIDVSLNDDKIPEAIRWTASNSTADNTQQAKAMLLSFWNGAEKTAMRVDLWTKDMMVDEMGDFFYQTMITMADSLQRATNNEALTTDMKNFARDFYKKFRSAALKENNL